MYSSEFLFISPEDVADSKRKKYLKFFLSNLGATTIIFLFSINGIHAEI